MNKNLLIFNLTKPEIFKIFSFFLVWRSFLFVIGAVAAWFLPYEPSFPYSESIFLPYQQPQWLYSWANFDGVHYLSLAEHGYLAFNYIQAFFPLFPVLIMVLNLVFNSSLVTGLLITNVMTLVLFFLWYNFAIQTLGKNRAWISLIILSIFPTSLFFGAFYTESLFLSLVLLSFLLARQRKWFLTGVVVALASGTRLVGIFLVPALAVEWWLQTRENSKSKLLLGNLKQQVVTFFHLVFKSWNVVIALSIGSLGLLSYMFFLNQHFQDPLYFLHVQSEFGGGRQENLVLFPQVVWRYFKIFVTYRPFDLKYLMFIEEFVFSMGTAVLLIIGFIKKIRVSYLVFAGLAFLLPTATGTFSSMGRYILVCFPIFLVLTQLLASKPKLLYLFIFFSALLLIVNTVLFIQGYWVA